jgi:hypothetical protein
MLIRDVKGDGIIDEEDIIHQSRTGGIGSEVFFEKLTVGSYILQVKQFNTSASNYTLEIDDTSVLGIPFP